MEPQFTLAALLIVCCGYAVATLEAVRALRADLRKPVKATEQPSVSVLKPAIGVGKEFADRLETWTSQDHPSFEILVGVAAGDLETRRIVQAAQDRTHHIPIKSIECPDPPKGCNGKVVALEALANHASHPVWVVGDADVRIPDRALRTLAAEASAPDAGFVTCLYRGVPGRNWASRVEAHWINTQFSAQAITARRIQGMRFTLGATTAFRAERLERIGGLEALRQFIGDDYHLGRLAHRNGLPVKVSRVTVATVAASQDSVRAVWQRQLRWARTIRMQRPLGHAGLPITFGMLASCLAIAIDPTGLWPLALVTAGIKAWAARVASSTVQALIRPTEAVLWPLCEALGLATWAFSYCGRTVRWGGRILRLGAQGRIES